MGTNCHTQVKPAPVALSTSLPRGALLRKCACGGGPGSAGACEECSKEKLKVQRHAVQQAKPSTVPPIVHDVLRSAGQPLDDTTRAFMEPRFGHDFSKVRIHTDAQAAESARAVNALAYTVNQDTVFATGQYAPETSAGKRLLAHELAHTVQQSTSSPSCMDELNVSSPHDQSEREADAIAATVMEGESSQASHKTNTQLARLTPGAVPNASEAQTNERPRIADASRCNPAAGLPNTTCDAYLENIWWLPLAYVNNATCACLETPNEPTANCVRKFLQDRMAATPLWLKLIAAAHKPLEVNPVTLPEYEFFVQTVLTPIIYQDHVDAYASCCCTSGPAPYPAWIGVTTIPLPCSVVGDSIRQYGSCHGTPGRW